MSFEASSKPATKKNFAQKFAKELEEHLAFGDKLAKSLSNPNLADVQSTPVEHHTTYKILHTYAGSAGKEDDHPTFTARVRDYIERHESKKSGDFSRAKSQNDSRDSIRKSPEKRRTDTDKNSSKKKTENRQASPEVKAFSTLDEKTDQQTRAPPSRIPYSSVEGRLPLSLPKRIQPGSGDHRKEASHSKSPDILNNSGNGLQGLDVRRSESAPYEGEQRLSHSESRKSADISQGAMKAGAEPASYLFPNMEKNISFKKKIISDSMQRLKNSVYNSGAPTRENSLKSGFQELDQSVDARKTGHELALKQILANTSLTYDNGDGVKSSEDSFHMRDLQDSRPGSRPTKSILDRSQASRDQLISDEYRGKNEERTIQDKYYRDIIGQEGDGSTIQLRELFRNSIPEGAAEQFSRFSVKRGSNPNAMLSSRDSFNPMQLFRPSETTEGAVMNVSRLGDLDDPMEIQERMEELRRYSMELGMIGNVDHTHDSHVKEAQYVPYMKKVQGETVEHSSTNNEQENTRYMSENVASVEGMKSLRTPDFQNYSGHMKDNHFFALYNQNQRNQVGDIGKNQKKNGVEGTKMSIIKKFSDELERGLANKPPVPQEKPVGPQDISEYQESQEMMGFLSFSKEYGNRTDETQQSPERYGYDVPVPHARDGQGRGQVNTRKNLKEEEKRERENNSVEAKLNETASKVNIKTFLALRSILKPHRAIVLCCEGLLKLLAGFEDIPLEIQEQESIEWNQIKVLFNSPVKFVNLVSSFKNLVNSGEISYQKIEAVELVLSRIQVHLDTPLHESFTQLHNFLSTAVQYYESCFQDSYKYRKDTFEEPERVRPVPIQYTEAPNSRPNIPVAQTYKPVSGPKKSPIQSRYSQGVYSPVKVSPTKVQQVSKGQRQAKSVGRGVYNKSPMGVVTGERQASGVRESQENKKQEKGRNVHAKSASRTPTKKNGGGKVENKRVVLGIKKMEDNEAREKEMWDEEIMEEEEKVRFLVDVEQSEAGELRDTIEAKEKEAREYRNKVKKMLFEHNRFVKKFLKQQEDLEDEINRDYAVEDWRRGNEMKTQQEEFERDWKHTRNMDYINEKKEVKEMKTREEKENMNELLLESLQDHYYHAFTVENKKENKKKELREKYKSVMADKIGKKQKETMESISLKEELAQKRKDHYKGRKIDIENEKNKWQSDYLMLSKLIGDAK